MQLEFLENETLFLKRQFPSMVRYQFFHSLIGDFFILEQEEKILALHQNSAFIPPGALCSSSPFLREASRELKAYFERKLKTFSLPYILCGSPFEKSIYQTLSLLPYGETLSYEALASCANFPNSARATANALAKNPLLLLIPCHRVICKNGKIGGFVLGEEKKKELLRLEGLTKGF